MNVTKLEKLAKYIETSKKFTMVGGGYDIVSHAAKLFGIEANTQSNTMIRTAQVLELDQTTAARLFFATTHHNHRIITAAEVAACIRGIIATGEVSWKAAAPA